MAQRIASHADKPYNKVVRPAWTEDLPGGYGMHSVLRYSVILWAEHDTALLREIEVGFHLSSRRYRSSPWNSLRQIG